MAKALAGNCGAVQGGEVMCEYCDMKNKPMAYRFDGIYKEKIYVQHLIPAKLRPNGRWIIKAEVASGPIYANINFCPMCGRKLAEEK